MEDKSPLTEAVPSNHLSRESSTLSFEEGGATGVSSRWHKLDGAVRDDELTSALQEDRGSPAPASLSNGHTQPDAERSKSANTNKETEYAGGISEGEDWADGTASVTGLFTSDDSTRDDTGSGESDGSHRSGTSKDSSEYKSYHSEIEKRRRKKINDTINEIAQLVPTCCNIKHRLDKLSILKLAVQHMRLITQKQELEANESVFKPPCFTEEEMKYLLEQSSHGFLFVLSADRAQILFVSDQISEWTNHAPNDLIGRSLLELAHSKDEKTIMDVLMPYPLVPSINMSNAATSDIKELLCGITGSKRSFFFRLNCSKQPSMRVEQHRRSRPVHQPILGNSFITVHCSGFLKSWQTSENPLYTVDKDIQLATFTCYIGVGRPVNIESARQNDIEAHSVHSVTQYSSRHSADARYLFVDPGVVPVSGYLPQDLIGRCEYDFVHQDDVKSLVDTYRVVLDKKHQEKVISEVYRMKGRHGGTIRMKTVAFSLFNPITEELEYVSHQNFVLNSGESSKSASAVADLGSVMDTSPCSSDTSACTSVETTVASCSSSSSSRKRKRSEGKSKRKSVLPVETVNFLKNGGVDVELLNSILSSRRAGTPTHDKSSNIGLRTGQNKEKGLLSLCGSPARSMPSMVYPSTSTSQDSNRLLLERPTMDDLEPTLINEAPCVGSTSPIDKAASLSVSSAGSVNGRSSGYNSAEDVVSNMSSDESNARFIYEKWNEAATRTL